MVVSGERSGSTWVANWLTTDKSICYHDPRMRWTEEQIRTLSAPGKRVGICCTYQGMDPEWANQQLVPTVILHRDPEEIRESFRKMGLIPFVHNPPLECVGGWHVDWRAPFDPAQAREIYEFLLWQEMDEARHKELVQMNIQPHWAGIAHSKESMMQLMAKIAGAIRT